MISPATIRSRRGVALVMSLFFICLITILVVGFITSMRVERFSADAHLQGVRAQHLAQIGVDAVAARIAQATQTGSFWITQPGRITRAALTSAGFTPGDLKNVDLHSGAMLTGDDNNLVADLNVPNLFSSSRNLITSQNVNLKVRWIYQRQDGTLIMPSGSTVPAYNRSNPLVGRFAFWADDEGAKVNLNTAWRRSITWPRWDPSQLNLMIFSGINSILADTLQSTRTGKHYFHSLDEARAADASFSSLIDSNRFDLTVLNRTPEINLFGEPRIMLTTKKALAGSQPYLNILVDENTDSGLIANVAGASASDKLAIVTSTLTSLLNRKDWPMNPGHSLAEKFAPVRPEQIALNIIEYVRARESAMDLVEPIRGDVLAGGKIVKGASNAVTAIFGSNRGPRITEVGVWVDKNTSTVNGVNGYQAIYMVELYLPPNCGIDKVDLTKFNLIRLRAIPSVTPLADPWSNPLITPADLDSSRPDTYLMAGTCRMVTRSFQIAGSRPANLILRMALCKNDVGSTRLDLASVVQVGGYDGLTYTVDSTGLTPDKIPSLEVSDPYVNRSKYDWSYLTQNTFGTPPSVPAVKASLIAQQDVDGSLLSSSSQRFPSASGTSSNLNGVMESVAELGFIHTGIECSTNGTPFRSIRLQPQKSAQVPDWALLDVFCVPYKNKPTNATVSYYLRDNDTGRGGLINLNAFRQNALVPFLDSGGLSLVQRKNGFLATVTDAIKDDAGASSINSSLANTLQVNVSLSTLATSVNAGRDYGFGKIFLSRGQLAEISGVSDGGELSEALMRGVIDLMDVRSNAFTVYAIGQAIQQTPTQIVIQAEQRTETLLIRDASGKVKQYFSRNLRP